MKLKDRTGALISDVFKGDPADKAGLKSGDVVIEINGKPIKDTHELLVMIAGFHVGEIRKDQDHSGRAGKSLSLTIAERTEKIGDGICSAHW